MAGSRFPGATNHPLIGRKVSLPRVLHNGTPGRAAIPLLEVHGLLGKDTRPWISVTNLFGSVMTIAQDLSHGVGGECSSGELSARIVLYGIWCEGETRVQREVLPRASPWGLVHRECSGHLTDRGGAICDPRENPVSTNTIREHTVINCGCFCA